MEPLILTVNSGSESRKYGLYKNAKEIAHLHIEHTSSQITGKLTSQNKPAKDFRFDSFSQATENLVQVLINEHLIDSSEDIHAVGVRIVAPSAKFLEDKLIDNFVIDTLKDLIAVAPLHLNSVISEISTLQNSLKSSEFYAISDTNFHSQKPDYAWNYSIPLDMADTHDIKKFGYHGISLASCIKALDKITDIPEKLVICHLGGGVSVSAIKNGVSIDTTMGFSPLEGLTMATRSGSIDTLAAIQLAKVNNMNLDELVDLLNHKSGLLGISGTSSDIRELIKREHNEDYRAKLALKVYVTNIQKAIGSMSAVLGGIDSLIFTGTVGIRSFEIRDRIVNGLEYLGLELDEYQNNQTTSPSKPTMVQSINSKNKIYVITPLEDLEIAIRTQNLYKSR